MTLLLPNADHAVLDIRKLEDYCLSPLHPRGRHKARVFREALGIERHDAAWLKDHLLAVARHTEATRLAADTWGTYRRMDATIERHGKNAVIKNDLDHTNRRSVTDVRYMLGAVMNDEKGTTPLVLDAVALLTDLPAQRLGRGQVGTIVELLDEKTSLVEFSDEQGRAYAIVPCPSAELLTLHYARETA